mmetsp:Transcript_9601/g.19060  ORF Transcript_9601/g.19060 Transcript_9601/m.19060 type:complete len:92 (+) Transcript_9601:1830-2105(+)
MLQSRTSHQMMKKMPHHHQERKMIHQWQEFVSSVLINDAHWRMLDVVIYVCVLGAVHEVLRGPCAQSVELEGNQSLFIQSAEENKKKEYYH